MHLYPNAPKVAIAAALTTISGLTNAGGFSLIEHGASGLGNAYAGSAAVAADASTIYFNPAGMLQLDSIEINLAGHAIVPDTTLTDEGTTLNTALGGTPVSGSSSVTNDDVTFIPNLYFNYPINNDFSAGLSVDVPFGSGSDYGDQWFGRYTATESSISIIDVNPALAYRINDRLHVGGGISVQFANASLQNSVDSGAVCFATAPDPAVCVNAGLTPGNLDVDSQAEIEGDSTAVGFNLGVMFIPADHTRIGVTFRSEVSHTLEGDATFDNSPEFQALLDATMSPAFVSGGGQVDVTTPAMAAISIAHTLQAYEPVELLADVLYTRWRSFDQILIEFDNPAQPDVLQIQDYDDAFRFSLGLNFQYSPKVILRTGVAFDQTPVRGPSRNTARIPDTDRTWLSFGLGYKASERISFDLGYTHIFLDDVAINNSFPEQAGATFLRASVESNVNLFSAQVNYKF